MSNNDLAFKVAPLNIVSNGVTNESEKDLMGYSSVSQYINDMWYIDKYYAKVNYLSSHRKIDFSFCNSDEEKSCVKNFAYNRLLYSYSLLTIVLEVGAIKQFTKFIKDEYSICSYEKLDEMNIYGYYNYITSLDNVGMTKHKNWNAIKELFKINELTNVYNIMEKYSVKYTEKVFKSRCVDDYIMAQLDKVMLKEDLPITYRIAYWLLRLYPSRATELFSTEIDCLKPFRDGCYIFSTKVFKTCGRDENGTPKMIAIDPKEPIQKKLVEMIQEQQEVANKIYSSHPEMRKFLFVFNKHVYRNNTYIKTKQIIHVTYKYFNNFIRKVIELYNIKDKDGHIPTVTSHCLRHNAISDRLNSNMFRPIDIMPMTKHGNTQMICNTYFTPTDPVTKGEDIRKFVTGETVIFNGKVINSKNDKAFDKYLKSPYAYYIKDLGICSDIRACNKSRFECLGCEYFIPDCKNLDYFEYQLEDWKRKYETASQNNNTYLEENALYNMKLLNMAISKVKKTLDKQKADEEHHE